MDEQAQLAQERIRMRNLLRSKNPDARFYARVWFAKHGEDEPRSNTVNWSDRGRDVR